MEKNYYDFLFLLTEQEDLSRDLAAKMIELDEDSIGFYNKPENKDLNKRGLPDYGALYYFFDILGEHKFVYETDWKADVDGLNFAIKWMAKGKITEDLMSEEDEEDCDGMFELIDNAQPILKELGFALLEFPHHGDAHAIALVSLDKLEVLKAKMPF